MGTTIAKQQSNNFEIIFQKLEEAKSELDINFIFSLEQASEANETVALFKEYQESLIQPTYTTFTKA